MSNYPGSLDNDASLYIAKDYISTRLSSAQGIADTVAVVASPAFWVPNMILTVDVGKANVEQQLVTAVLGNVLTVTRAFAGTSAVAHAAGASVTNEVDAIYQSSLKSAIIAVQTTLGANLSNIPTGPFVVSTTYKFSPLTPGGSLNVGANTITLSPMPLGILAGSVGISDLYISGGTGTAEAVPIIGRTATTVTVTCANTHSGAWTIQSATAGVQEALIFALAGGSGPAAVFIPAGQHVFQSGVTVPGVVYASFRGAGEMVTLIQAGTTEKDIFHYNPGSNVDFGDMAIYSTPWRTTCTGLWIEGVSDGVVSNLRVSGQNVAILARSTARVFLDNIMISANTNCMQVDASASGAYNFNNTCQISNVRALPNTGGVGIMFKPQCTGITATNIFTEGGGYGIRVIGDLPASVNEIQFNNLILDAYTAIGLDINLSDVGAVASRISIDGAIIGSVGGGLSVSGSYAIAARAAAVNQITDLSISNVRCYWYSNGGAISSAGIIVGGTRSLLISDVTLRSGEGFGAGIEFTAPATAYTSISGSRIGQDVSGASTGAGIAQRGILIGAQAHLDIYGDGLRLAGSVATVSNNSTDLTTIEFTQSCRTLPNPSIASAAAFPIPAFPTFVVTGNTGVTSVTGLDVGHAGRSGTFIATHATPAAWTAGATIGNTFTPTQNVLVKWFWDGTKIYLS